MDSRHTTCAPVLLLGFNRPNFMAAQITAVKTATPSKVYIAVDGPREDRPDEAALCQQTRDCAKLIDWPCEVKTLFREKNLGCKYGVSGAITWFFENEEEGIVLEDDCRPTFDFLRFATEMLGRYKNNDRIGAICGFNFFNLQSDKTKSYHFSSHMDVWGWASWRRVWKDYDVEATKNQERHFAVIERSDSTAYYKKFYKKLVNDVEQGLSTWDVQMSLLFLEKGYLSIVPKVRLIANAGLADNRATHTGGYVYWAHEWARASALEFPLSHPASIECDSPVDRLRECMEGALIPRALTWLGVKFPILCGIISATGRATQRVLPFLFRL